MKSSKGRRIIRDLAVRLAKGTAIASDRLKWRGLFCQMQIRRI